jgi:hypothetical protein
MVVPDHVLSQFGIHDVVDPWSRRWVVLFREALASVADSEHEEEAFLHSTKRPRDEGGFRQLSRLESYGSQDTMAAAMKEGGAFASLVEGMTKFIDQDRDADWSSGLYKAVTDTSMWGEA